MELKFRLGVIGLFCVCFPAKLGVLMFFCSKTEFSVTFKV